MSLAGVLARRGGGVPCRGTPVPVVAAGSVEEQPRAGGAREGTKKDEQGEEHASGPQELRLDRHCAMVPSIPSRREGSKVTDPEGARH